MQFNLLHYNEPLFHIDATYVIHLLNNGRYESMMKQLNTYKPSEKVYILENPGYETKPYIEQTPSEDLIHCFKHIFKHAKKNKNKTILILEDDFFFTNDIYNENLRQIEKILKQSKSPLLYYLGTLPILRFQSYLFFSIGTHAILYNEASINKCLTLNIQNDYDIFINKHFLLQKYLTKKPLCYQLFPITENKKKWYYVFGFSEFLNYLIKILELDKQIELGYGFFYFVSQFIFILCCLIILFYIKKLILKK